MITGSDTTTAHTALTQVGVWVPTTPTTTPVRLTRREREVATLAAGGMTNKAIAQRLVLSVRTVDSHLSSAYHNLGVHSREQLAEAIEQRSIHARRAATA